MAKMGITIYGCGQDEAVLFREMAPRFGVMPTITAAPVSEANIELAFGNRCISVSHKTQITNSILRALSTTTVVMKAHETLRERGSGASVGGYDFDVARA